MPAWAPGPCRSLPAACPFRLIRVAWEAILESRSAPRAPQLKPSRAPLGAEPELPGLAPWPQVHGALSRALSWGSTLPETGTGVPQSLDEAEGCT